MQQPWIDFIDLIWQTNINGYEAGYDQYAELGLFLWRDTEVTLLIEMETMEIVSISEDNE